MDLEEYALDRCPVPDLTKLTETDRSFVEELWERVSKIEVTSLIDQLREGVPFRRELDEGLLKLLGVSDKQERSRLATSFEKGAYAAINALLQSMVGGVPNERNDEENS